MQGSNGATVSFHRDMRYTSLELISHRDACSSNFETNHHNLPALLVWGGARVVKTLCTNDLVVQGDAVIEGNLAVLGKCFTEQSEVVTITDRNICLGNVIGMPATDITANTGGILIKSTPGHTKSWVWLNDIGGSGAWNSNQDINIGVGRVDRDGMGSCPGCGPDTLLRGTAYRIDDLPVLTLTELGNTVVNSSLETVGTLYKGAINNSYFIQTSVPGSPTCITTTQSHGYMPGDVVMISGCDAAPSINGCRTVVSILNSTTFCIAELTFSPATTGFVKGPTFPIDIGTSPLWSGTHTVQCGENLVVNDEDDVTRFFMNGTTHQLDLNNEVSVDYTEKITSIIPGSFAGIQRSLWILNDAESSTLSSLSVGADIEQTYGGTNTFYVDSEMTVHNAGLNIQMNTEFQFVTPRITSRAIDVTSKSPNNKGSNVGVYAEAGGAINCNHSSGVIGFTNPQPNTGLFSTGVMGCVNKTRQDIADTIAAYSVGMGTKAGGFFCNPNIGPDEWGLIVEGETLMNGNTIITGDLTVLGNSNITANIGAICVPKLRLNELTACFGGNTIIVSANLLPQNGLDLGSSIDVWEHAYINNGIISGNLEVNGALTYLGTDTTLVHDNFITVNVAQSANVCTSGLMIQRFQMSNDSCTGVVVDDVPPQESNSLQTATATTAQLALSASLMDDFYNGWWIKMITGAAVCEVRQIVSYVGATRNATLSSSWTLTPSSTDLYELYACNYTGIYWNETKKKWFLACTADVSGDCLADDQTFLQDLCVRELLAESIVVGNIIANNAQILDTVTINTLVVSNISVGMLTTNTLQVLDKLTAQDFCVLGNTMLFGPVTIDNDVTIDGDITSTGNVCANELCGNTLQVFDTATIFKLNIINDVDIGGNVLVNGDLCADNICANNLQIFDTLTITDLHINGMLTVDGETVLNDNVNVNGDVTATGNICADELCANTAQIFDKLTVANLCVTNDAQLLGTLTVDGQSTFNQNVNVNADLTATGNICADMLCSNTLQIFDTATISNLIIVNDTTLNGQVTINNDVSVFGNITATGKVCADELCANNAQVFDKLIVGNLCVLNDTQLFGNLIVDGIITAPNITITGNIVVEGNLCANVICAIGEVLTVACTEYRAKDATTVGITPVILATLPMTSNKICFLNSKLVVSNVADATNAKAFNRLQAFYNNAGVLTAMGPATTPDSWATGAGTGGWACTYVISGTNIDVTILGQIGKTLNWRACIEVICE